MKRKVTIIKYKKENEMKKITALIFALILTLGLVGCNGKTVNIDFPFEVEDVESVEMYHYDGVPASAEKKVVVAESDIKTLYDMFKGLSLKDKTAEETAGADVTSFRFNLSDGSSYDLIYACDGVKNGKLKSEAGDFEYFTSADIGSYWNNLNTSASRRAPMVTVSSDCRRRWDWMMKPSMSWTATWILRNTVRTAWKTTA